MATSVVFNNNAYSVPNSGETNWADLSDFLIEVAGFAQTTNKQIFNIRQATASPVSVVAATDFTVIVNVAGAAAVTLPTGVDGQLFCIVDGSGAAVTNNITVSGTGGQTIGGAASYVITRNRQAAIFQFFTTGQWQVIGEALTKSLTFPTTGTLATLAGSETFTNKTLTAPTINSPTITDATLGIADAGTGDLNIASASGLTASRTLTLDVNDAARTVDLTGNLVLAGSLTTVGAFATTLTATNTTTLTLPVTGTLATLAGSETLSNKTMGSTNTLTGVTMASITNTGTVTFPSSTDTLVGRATTDTLTNKTLTSPAINSPTIVDATLGITDAGTGDLQLASDSGLSSSRILTFDVNNAARRIDLTGNLTLAADFVTSGANSLTLTTTGSTNVTLPTSGTLLTSASFVTGTSGTDFNISGTTFNLPSASASNRGAVTTGTQTLAGAKTFTAMTTIAYSDTASGTGQLFTSNTDTTSSSQFIPGLWVAKGFNDTSNNNRFIQFSVNGTGSASGGIVANGASNATFVAISDGRLKEEIKAAAPALEKIMKLEPVSYKWKNRNDRVTYGLIAQEVASVFPEHVCEYPNEGDEFPDIKALVGNIEGFPIVLVKAIQELKSEVDRLTGLLKEKL